MIVPTKPGFYWAKWRIADDGTVEGVEMTPQDRWEPVEVFDNNATDEPLRVFVCGVQKSQTLKNFVWGNPIEEPKK